MTDLFNPGGFFIFGFEGLNPDKSFLDLVETFPPAGIVFLGSNYESPSQLTGLVEYLRGLIGPKTIFAVDQEPGRVQRFKNGFPLSLSPREYVTDRLSEEYSDWCDKTASILYDIGINMNLTPVVDLAPFDNPPSVLRERSFGAEPADVIKYSDILIKAHKRKNVLTCAKHFPGLGSTSDDPHETVAVSKEPLKRFIDYHWIPFIAAVKSGVDSVMTTHLLASALDNENPGSYSATIIRHLREAVNFEGLTISDDLLMTGAGDCDNIASAVERSLAAGHNLVMISKDIPAQRKALEHVSRKYSSDDTFREILLRSENEIEKIKSRISPR